jgi:hypothetical protein
MVQTDLDVCNLAITRIGGEPIDALDETTPQGAWCVAQYPQARDWCLGKYRWAFANKIAPLSPRLVTPTDCPAAFAYDIPADVIGAIFAYRSAAKRDRAFEVRAELVNGYIASDCPTLFIEHTGRVAENKWPVWFVEFVKTVFASGMASGVGQNTQLAAQLYQMAFGTPGEAGEGGLYQQSRNEDSRNAPPRTAFGAGFSFDDGDLVNARFGPGFGFGPAWLSIPFVGLPGSFGFPTFIDFGPSGDG